MKTLVNHQLFILTFFFLCFIFSTKICAQEQDRDLRISNGLWSYKYHIGDKVVSSAEFKQELQLHEKASKMYKSGNALNVTGTVLGGIGAFVVGYDLGSRLGDGSKGNTALLASGGVGLAGGIILYYIGEGKMKKAITLYNNSKQTSSLTLDTQGLGVRLCWAF